MADEGGGANPDGGSDKDEGDSAADLNRKAASYCTSGTTACTVTCSLAIKPPSPRAARLDQSPHRGCHYRVSTVQTCYHAPCSFPGGKERGLSHHEKVPGRLGTWTLSLKAEACEQGPH